MAWLLDPYTMDSPSVPIGHNPTGITSWRAGCGESRTSGSAGGLWETCPGKPGQRAQDRPHCEKPASACDSHHLRAWLQGGPTQLENLTLLCPHHHRLVHNSEWEIRMVNGFPEFIPPAYVD